MQRVTKTIELYYKFIGSYILHEQLRQQLICLPSSFLLPAKYYKYIVEVHSCFVLFAAMFNDFKRDSVCAVSLFWLNKR